MNELLAAHLDRVLRFLHRLTGDPHDAADLAQETFLRAWRGRSSLRDSAAARTWLLRIATNTFRDWLRSKGRQPEIASLTVEPPAAASASRTQNHTARLENQDEVAQAIAALQTLPPRQREVLTLHACEELSIDEIAEVLEIDRRAVKSSLSVARAAMRKKCFPPDEPANTQANFPQSANGQAHQPPASPVPPTSTNIPQPRSTR